MPELTPRVVAVVVTFQPDRVRLRALLDAVTEQVEGLVLVDNGDAALFSSLGLVCRTKVQTLGMGENRGLAAAQNRGIGKAREWGAEFVLLLDQDSVPAGDMVSKLMAAMMGLRDRGLRVAAVGPRYTDQNQIDLRPFVRVRNARVERFDCGRSDRVVEVDHLIASGSLVPVTALDAIGGMREDLFIDHIDTEWGLRARCEGYRLFGVCGAAMRHGLGDRPYRFLGRYVPIHSPLRHYYLFRNTVWLCRQGWIPWHWRLAIARSAFFKLLFFAIVPRERLSQIGMIFRGVCDGWRGRMGRLET